MKKILIVANGAISNIDSNGRTIARLFDCFSKEEKAQFYTYGDPDYSQCISFYKVSDNDVLNSVIKLRKIDGREVYKKIENQISEKPALKKTPLILILREFLWKLGLWRNKYLKQWIDSINPNCIFLYLGDNYFTIDLAIWISKIKSIPIIVYSTEEYLTPTLESSVF